MKPSEAKYDNLVSSAYNTGDYLREFASKDTDSEFVLLPRDEYASSYKPEVISHLFTIAAELEPFFHQNKHYPNSRFHLAHFNGHTGDIASFFLVWGDKTDQHPSPRQHFIPEYFTPRQLRISNRRRQKLFANVLDGYGVTGKVTLKGEEPSIKTRFADRAVKGRQKEYTDYTSDLLVPGRFGMKIVERLTQHNPIRLHQGIQHNPWNGYIANHRFDDDQDRSFMS